MPETELFAVTGKPVAHSLSPELFRLLFRAFGRNAVYTRMAADSAEEALETARAIGLRGLNVTSPFKEEMISRLDRLDEHAAKIGAANCLALAGANSAGYNTDFIGLIGTLYSAGVSPEGRTALVLGTGGAARAAAYALVRAKAARVILAGRSIDRARAAARGLGCDAAPLDDAERILGAVDVCVSCLSFPAARILPDPAPTGALIVDAHYANAATAPEDGPLDPSTALRWLFHQAIPSFEIFTGLEVSKSVERKIWEDFMMSETHRKPHIALVGFMGAGKTATGRQLARLMGCEFTDIDEAIEGATRMTIPEIFKLRGESSFRSLEKSAIEERVSGGARKVISVGGGAVLDENSRKILAKNCRIVWLWVPARTAIQRIDVSTRPVLSSDRPLESAERTLAARTPLYASLSDLIVNSESGTPLEVAGRIKDEMDQAL